MPGCYYNREKHIADTFTECFYYLKHTTKAEGATEKNQSVEIVLFWNIRSNTHPQLYIIDHISHNSTGQPVVLS